MFDAKIKEVRQHFGIVELADWNTISPEQIMRVKGVGPRFMAHLRLFLATQETTLSNDESPEYWLKHADTSRVAKRLSFEDCNVLTPFTVLIDSMEQIPFTFQSIAVDAKDTPADLAQLVKDGEIDQEAVHFEVRKSFQALGIGKGDYSILGFDGQCNIERKSKDDAHGTILGWGDRRRRFETELENLAAMECAAVVVECSFGELLADAPSRGKKTSDENRKILHRQVLSWQQKFRVPWVFCDSRRLAEISTFRIMQRFYRKQIESPKPDQVTSDI